MSSDTAAVETSLAHELTPGPGITFDLDGKSYELPKPFTMRLWLKLLLMVRGDPGSDDSEWFALNIASHAEDMVLWATKLTQEQFRALPQEDYQRVKAAVADQLGEELADASPFSPARQALDTLHQASKLAQAMAAKAKKPVAGGTPA